MPRLPGHRGPSTIRLPRPSFSGAEDNGPGPARISKMLKHNGARPQGRVPHPGPGRREEACEPEELALSGLRPVTHGADLVSVSGSALESVLRDNNEVYH